MIRGSTLQDRVVDQVREAILTGVFPPGQRLLEPELARRFGVSVTPVREALSVLAGRGLIVRNGRFGSYVRTLNVADVKNLFALRKALECLALRQVARHLTEEDFARMDANLERQARANSLTETARLRSTLELSALNDEFHDLFIARAGNEWLSSMLLGIRDLLEFTRVRLREIASLERRDETLRDHHRIVKALRASDVEAAVTALFAHLDRLEKDIILRLSLDGDSGRELPVPAAESSSSEAQVDYASINLGDPFLEEVETSV